MDHKNQALGMLIAGMSIQRVACNMNSHWSMVIHLRNRYQRQGNVDDRPSPSSGKHVRAMNTPETPLLNSKTGVYRGIPIFFLFLHQNIDCVVPTIYVLSKNKKNIKNLLVKFSISTATKSLCILHGVVFVMVSRRRSEII